MESQSHDAASRLWKDVETLSKICDHNRLQLAKCFFLLRNLYSERAAGRLSSGHGTFVAEIKKRGFKPNRVREMIVDYEVSEGLRPPSQSTASKRRARRSNSEEYQRGYHEAIRRTHAALDDDPVVVFARLLPYAALKSAFRTALQELHPDHGGSDARTQELIRVWEEVERSHDSVHGVAPELRVQ